MLGSIQARQVSASGEPRYVRTRQAKREQIALQKLGPRSERKPKRRCRRNQPRELAFYCSVKPVETLEDESIAVQREIRIEQVQLSLERLVLGRDFSAKPQMKR
jgi:hypothetical protein